MIRRLGFVLAFTLTACGSSQAPPDSPAPEARAEAHTDGPPVAAVRPVVNTYHGTAVTDPYQWLEGNDDEVRAWAAAQNRYARAQLDALPNLAAVTAEIEKLAFDPSPDYARLRPVAGRLFATKKQPPREQAILVVFDDIDEPSSERTLLDPTTLDDEQTLSIDWYVPSPDGKRVAVSMSRRGSEIGDLSVYDVATGAKLPDQIPHVENGTAGADLAWTADSKGFYYTRYPREGERPENERQFYQQLWYHELGKPVASDRYELGKDLPRIAEIRIELHPASGLVLSTVQNGDGGDFAHYLREKDGRWTQLSRFGDGIKGMFFAPSGAIVILSRVDAPRGKLLLLAPGARDVSKARVIVPQSNDAIAWEFHVPGGFAVTANRIYAVYQKGGPNELRVFDHDGTRLPGPPQDAAGSTFGLTPAGGDDLLYWTSSFITPLVWHRLDASTGTSRALDSLSRKPVADFSDVTVSREMATSKDGTRVPVTIIARKDHPRDGSAPCIANGYGGYGINIEPSYRPFMRPFLDRGVCFAVANLRGGGEFGEAWHRAGMLTNKQNVFDDFAAVLKHLVARGYTSHERLGIIGGSNGGLLMGALLTQHPHLVRAVASLVGIYDMLRVELSPNGEFNITEFGTVNDEAQFRALHAYSPYHAVKDGTAYPAVLFTHGDNDPRVAPWQSRKMVARVQAATSSARPILLRTSAKSGHGASNLSERVSSMAHTWAFLLHHIGATDPG